MRKFPTVAPRKVVSGISTATVALPSFALADPAPPRVMEHRIPRAGSFPHDPAVSLVRRSAEQLHRLVNPATSDIRDHPTPTPNPGRHGLVVGPDGSVCYTAQAIGAIGRLDPPAGRIIEYPLGPDAPHPHTRIFHLGPVWLTDATRNSHGRLDPATGRAEVWSAPTPCSMP